MGGYAERQSLGDQLRDCLMMEEALRSIVASRTGRQTLARLFTEQWPEQLRLSATPEYGPTRALTNREHRCERLVGNWMIQQFVPGPGICRDGAEWIAPKLLGGNDGYGKADNQSSIRNFPRFRSTRMAWLICSPWSPSRELE
jgi:hypothetical protein